MEKDPLKGRRKIKEARAKLPSRDDGPSKCHDRLDVLYLDKKSIKVLRDQENAHSATFPQSLGNRWRSRDRLDRGKDPPEDVPPVGEFSAEMK